jgi:hypothetical protein
VEGRIKLCSTLVKLNSVSSIAQQLIALRSAMKSRGPAGAQLQSRFGVVQRSCGVSQFQVTQTSIHKEGAARNYVIGLMLLSSGVRTDCFLVESIVEVCITSLYQYLP